ncbi:hypothetical protein [Novosphingobium sp. BL-52-GroH]|uniref:hypothetical protein n=1 Tax=Novosphingobium sp. BL-52-GroH TaxID=3349877 RepID=UPI00384F52C5
MAVIILGFMWAMYKNRRANAAILVAGVVAFIGSLWLVRSQETVDAVAWPRRRPHH